MRVVSFGECMIEVSASADGALIGFGGDTFNTAAYLARQGIDVDYATALGDDPWSDEMLALFQAERVGTGRVVRLAGRLPGLYTIRTGPGGERRFHYWRDRAPARELFTHPAARGVVEALPEYDLLYFSGISLSLYGEEGRAALGRMLDAARAGRGTIAFDGNYRPAGWASTDQARAAVLAILGKVCVAMPTFEDEQALWGDASPGETAARLLALGVGEVVVKDGPRGALVASKARPDPVSVPVPDPVEAIDTTAAGDSFNAGYLAGRLGGLGPEDAAVRGHRLAGAVVKIRGALIPPAAMPDLTALVPTRTHVFEDGVLP